MAVRMTGLVSGMDTESIVKELMKAQKLKTTKIENKVTKLEWKKEKWSDLNKKVYSFYTGSLAKMKMQGNYSTKTATASNSDKVSVTAGASAPVGTHTLQVKETASAQFVTGTELGAGVDGSTLLTTLGFASSGTAITMKSGSNAAVTLNVDGSTTVNDVLTKLSEAGISANYDTNQHRFFINSKESGVAGAFSITSTCADYTSDKEAIKTTLGYATLDDTQKASIDGALTTYYDTGSTAEQKAAAKATLEGFATVDTLDVLKSTMASKLTKLGLDEISNTNGTVSVPTGSKVGLVTPSDAKVIYNGAELTSSSNTITANGLTFTLKGETAADETVSITITNDTQATYNMVKQYIKDYNELLSSMNEAYYADSAYGYDPLTDDEKEAMSDTEVEKWESKIKNSLLRRDSTLGSLINTLKSTTTKGYESNGKTYTLADFGIGTTVYTEKGKLHINGDKEDSTVASKDDALMTALSENPEAVMETLTQLTGEIYQTFTKDTISNEISSALTFYNDKEITTSISKYKDQLDDWEDRLSDMEDRYFKQFAAMESAMEKMNSQSSYISSYLGS